MCIVLILRNKTTKGLELHLMWNTRSHLLAFVTPPLSHVIYSAPVWKGIFVLFCFYFTYMYYFPSVSWPCHLCIFRVLWKQWREMGISEENCNQIHTLYKFLISWSQVIHTYTHPHPHVQPEVTSMETAIVFVHRMYTAIISYFWLVRKLIVISSLAKLYVVRWCDL